MPKVFVAAGSNIEPEKNLANATHEMEQSFPDIRFSPWYRNRAVGFEGADFINLVAGFTTTLTLPELVKRLREIEELCGRPREAPKWAARSMDLDILLYGDVVCDEPGLKLPRPDLVKRPYMLGPMADIAPEVIHPTAHVSIGELWEQFDQASHEMVRLRHGGQRYRGQAVAAGATTPHCGRRPRQGSDR